MKFHDLPSKAAQLRYMKEQLANDTRWLLRGLLTIYSYQTADEQRSEHTNHENGVGFNHADAAYLSSIAVQIINKGAEAAIRNAQPIEINRFLSEKQIPIVQRKMQKYAEQLCKIARNKKQ